MTWFPFDGHVVLNGLEWLARDFDKANIDYRRRDNCFAHISDFERAQKLAAKHPKIGCLIKKCRVLETEFIDSRVSLIVDYLQR